MLKRIHLESDLTQASFACLRIHTFACIHKSYKMYYNIFIAGNFY